MESTSRLVCTLCGEVEQIGQCSALAAVTLHWMNDHPVRWGELHPECTPYMPNHPNYRET